MTPLGFCRLIGWPYREFVQLRLTQVVEILQYYGMEIVVVPVKWSLDKLNEQLDKYMHNLPSSRREKIRWDWEQQVILDEAGWTREEYMDAIVKRMGMSR